MNCPISSLDLSYELEVRLDALLDDMVVDLFKQGLSLSDDARDAIMRHLIIALTSITHDAVNAENGDDFIFPDFRCLHCRHSYGYREVPHRHKPCGELHHETFGFHCRKYDELYGEDEVILGNIRTECCYFKEARE